MSEQPPTPQTPDEPDAPREPDAPAQSNPEAPNPPAPPVWPAHAQPPAGVPPVPVPAPGQGYPPPPGYPPPGYPPAGPGGYAPVPGYGYPPAQSTSTTGIVGLVLAVASWLVCPLLPAIVALVLAHQSDKEIAASQGRVGGAGLNTATRIVAWINVGLYAALILVVGAIFGIAVIAGLLSNSTA